MMVIASIHIPKCLPIQHTCCVVMLLLLSIGLYSQENSSSLCSDGIDNDGDGLVDCEDGDCQSICADNLLGECVTIDFETVLGEVPETQTVIENQFLGQGVRFSLSNGEFPILVDYGGQTEAFFGAGGDTPQPEYEDELGGFFITDDGISGGAEAFTIILDFQLPVNEVSGQILDIDNQEVFTAYAYDLDGVLLESTVISTSSPNTDNGVPTTWNLESDGCIWQVQLEGVSDGFTSFGYGLDNFEFCYGEIEELCECSGENAESDWLESICFGCTDPEACNYNPDSLNDNDTCIYPDGCTDSEACNYDSEAQCDDGSCLYGLGCMDPEACNYDPLAECDNGNCIFPDGCTDPDACNYVFFAECDDGSCFYPDGCTDSVACNYDSTALCDDGTCDYSCLGCTDPIACNYESDPEITVDDGSCLYPGCTDPSACNYLWTAGCDDGSCILPDGCTFPNACNYNPEALCNDGSCDFISCADCAGVPFGLSVIDTCGVCILPDDPLFNYSCVGQLYVPNSFTPNGDGINDAFYVMTARTLLEYELKIYNRWGELIHLSREIDEPWLGSDNGGEYYIPDGLYTYLVVYSFSTGDIKKQVGTVSVMR